MGKLMATTTSNTIMVNKVQTTSCNVPMEKPTVNPVGRLHWNLVRLVTNAYTTVMVYDYFFYFSQVYMQYFI